MSFTFRTDTAIGEHYFEKPSWATDAFVLVVDMPGRATLDVLRTNLSEWIRQIDEIRKLMKPLGEWDED
jgi:hypothetical protein